MTCQVSVLMVVLAYLVLEVSAQYPLCLVTASKMAKEKVKPLNTMQVVGADGRDLRAVGTISCKIQVGEEEVEQSFIVNTECNFRKIFYKDKLCWDNMDTKGHHIYSTDNQRRHKN